MIKPSVLICSRCVLPVADRSRIVSAVNDISRVTLTNEIRGLLWHPGPWVLGKSYATVRGICDFMFSLGLLWILWKRICLRGLTIFWWKPWHVFVVIHFRHVKAKQSYLTRCNVLFQGVLQKKYFIVLMTK